MAENFQKAIEDLTLEEAQAEIRRAWDMWREMDDLHDQACDWAIAANSLRVRLQERVEEAEAETEGRRTQMLNEIEVLVTQRNEARALAERRKKALEEVLPIAVRTSRTNEYDKIARARAAIEEGK